jgi:hypothetical protein
LPLPASGRQPLERAGRFAGLGRRLDLGWQAPQHLQHRDVPLPDRRDQMGDVLQLELLGDDEQLRVLGLRQLAAPQLALEDLAPTFAAVFCSSCAATAGSCAARGSCARAPASRGSAARSAR